MANENDAVRLKHLKSLASVVHDITLHSGGASLPDNADFALYVPNDTSIIITGKQAPVLLLGSWSAVDTVYSVPITYTGDGTLSTDIGTISNDILTIEDTDGNFSGVISASAGDDYSATKTNFSYATDRVTVTIESGGSSGIAGGKTIPELTVGSFSTGTAFTALITYTGDGTVGAIGGTINGSTLTLNALAGIVFAKETDNYTAAITDWALPPSTGLITYLPFDNSLTEDLCNGTWDVVGSPTIETDNAIYSNALKLSAKGQYLARTTTLLLGGQDFTIDCYAIISSSSGSYPTIFGILGSSKLKMGSAAANSSQVYISGTGFNPIYSSAISISQRHHYAMVYQHTQKTITFFVDGIYQGKASITFNQQSCTVNIGRELDSSGTPGANLVGMVDEFRIFNGVAWWTENFTPPTAEDYAALRAELAN